MTLVMWVIVFVISLFALIKSADHFTKHIEKIAESLGLHIFLVGVLIVGFATSIPELVTSIFAVIEGGSEIVIGNVVGSNIANILLIIGFTGVFIAKKGMKVKFNFTRADLPVMILAAFFVFFACIDGKFTWQEGLIGVVGYLLYLFLTKVGKFHASVKRKKSNLAPLDILGLVVSLLVIFLAADFTVKSILNLSGFLGIGNEVIAMSVVALGTSLPELFVALQAVKRRLSGLVFGTIVGSCIYNSLIVMGIPSFIGDISVPKSVLYYSLPVMVGATLIYSFMSLDKRISKLEAGILLVLYVLFIWKLFF